MNNVKIHTAKNATWTNAAGDAVPFKFVPKSDRSKETLAGKILKDALAAETALVKLHGMMKEAFAEVQALIKAEYELKYDKKQKEGKGSLTWFNFDRSIKVEADVNEIVKWDAALMTEALSQLNSYLETNLTDANILIKKLVESAFANSKGMVDTGKVFQILKHEKDIKHKSFQKACELLKQAQSIDRTKLYMRIWIKADDGSYRNVNLNFSNL